ncbi:MAG: glycerol-3-phosphate 1-O-acyltransferase PlsY [Candidatus Omnitrophota bacterium]|nr:glycerol-3-phosphate 1-O-acyltransferase PlsY [Candidatus Omnitrophota bacterium]
MVTLSLLIISYFLGSIPFGFLVAKGVKKIDIRKVGSGNIGATNVFRVVGKKWGILVFILDFLKGIFAPILTRGFLPSAENYIYIVSAVLPICGHNWTPFLKFKGGKGVATSLGAIAGLGFIFPKLWVCIVLALCGWIAVFSIFKYVSLASIVATAIFFVFSLIFSLPVEVKVLSFFLFLFILIRHKTNIKKLLSKKEHRF